ncbi:MAG: multidrug effflux MFS transporter [Terrabacter sp.]
MAFVPSEVEARHGSTTDGGDRAAPALPSPRGRARSVLLASLALLSMISPFATDMYLPSFPRIADDLSTGPSGVQLTLTTFLVGVALGQLFFGPLSDRCGRKRPLVAGSLLCVVASFVAVYAPTIEVLLAARFFQGLGGAAGIVIARAIVADLFLGAEAASIFSVLAVLGGLAPIVAPVAGGLLAGPVGWRGVLGVLAALTVTMSLVAVLVIRESAPVRTRGTTSPPAPRPSSPPARTPHLGTVLRRPGFTAYALVKTFSFAVLMGYIAASPFIYQDYIGVGELAGAALFGLNSLGMIAANAVNARFVRSRGPARMLQTGLVLLTTAVAALSLVVLLPAPPWALVPVFVVLVGSMGFIFGNSIGLAISHARDAAGSGSAVIGFGQFVAGAAVAPLVGLGGLGERATPVPMTLLLVAATGATWVCAVIGKRASVPGD